jgi:hypothetical protein
MVGCAVRRQRTLRQTCKLPQTIYLVAAAIFYLRERASLSVVRAWTRDSQCRLSADKKKAALRRPGSCDAARLGQQPSHCGVAGEDGGGAARRDAVDAFEARAGEEDANHLISPLEPATGGAAQGA